MASVKTNTRETLMWQLEQQRRCDNPPYVKDAFRRLSDAGHGEDAIFEMCMWVLAAEYFRMLILKRPWDMERYGRGLKRLPVMPWEDNGSDYPADITQENVQDAILDNPNMIMETSEQTKERYIRLRSRLQDIQRTMTPLIDPMEFRASAQALGVLKGKTIVAKSEDTLSVVADHCIYANPKYRLKVLKAYRSRHSKSMDSECKELLDAVEKARYAVLFCEGVLTGLGVQMRNLLTGEVIRLIDIGMAETVERGLVICSHIIAPYGMYMTTGAPLPIPSQAAIKNITSIIEDYIDHDRLRPDGIKNDHGEFAARVINTLLRHEAVEHMEYA